MLEKVLKQKWSLSLLFINVYKQKKILSTELFLVVQCTPKLPRTRPCCFSLQVVKKAKHLSQISALLISASVFSLLLQAEPLFLCRSVICSQLAELSRICSSSSIPDQHGKSSAFPNPSAKSDFTGTYLQPFPSVYFTHHFFFSETHKVREGFCPFSILSYHFRTATAPLTLLIWLQRRTTHCISSAGWRLLTVCLVGHTHTHTSKHKILLLRFYFKLCSWWWSTRWDIGASVERCHVFSKHKAKRCAGAGAAPPESQLCYKHFPVHHLWDDYKLLSQTHKINT